MTALAAAPGFFGKLPSHGDFVGRRLPSSMRDPFDAWLQRGIVASREALGAGWQAAWLSSPLWRFVLAPGLCGPEAWSGVMMPSMDRVGRCFPLVLAAPSMEAPTLSDCLGLHEDWFVRLEEIALTALGEGASLDRLDAALLALGGFAATHAQGFSRSSMGIARCVALDDASISALVIEDMDGDSAWWGLGSELVAPCLARCRSLPSSNRFAALLEGEWREHGWS
ncbi:type VI secretion system-associated protein TagF [Telluria beijingensis]|uniref:type VI secretion system-associated protein TagF n=1 Tax=Telluria beijingensis TaxID=3068633 RepID=UPI0027955081|nr:type VI secretion system-associated protein TagF [Massilia sp. REN29]